MDSQNNNQTDLTSPVAGKKNKFTPDEILNTNILDLMGAKNMSEEEKNELYEKMIDTIEMRVISRIDSRLSDIDVEHIKSAIKTNDKEKFAQIFRDKKINVEQIYTEETLAYKFEMIELINKKSEE